MTNFVFKSCLLQTLFSNHTLLTAFSSSLKELSLTLLYNSIIRDTQLFSSIKAIIFTFTEIQSNKILSNLSNTEYNECSNIIQMLLKNFYCQNYRFTEAKIKQFHSFTIATIKEFVDYHVSCR